MKRHIFLSVFLCLFSAGAIHTQAFELEKSDQRCDPPESIWESVFSVAVDARRAQSTLDLGSCQGIDASHAINYEGFYLIGEYCRIYVFCYWYYMSPIDGGILMYRDRGYIALDFDPATYQLQQKQYLNWRKKPAVTSVIESISVR